MKKLNIISKKFNGGESLPEKHPMLGGEYPQYDIVFDHKGQKVSLSAGINNLNNKWMWWFSIEKSMHYESKKDVTTLVKNIRKKTSKIYLDTFGWVK